MFRQPRLVDPKYLAWLRKLPCTVCSKPAPSDAAHIRFGSVLVGKRAVGMGEKPDDRWAVSLCRACHTDQHANNEFDWWQTHSSISPLTIAVTLYGFYGGTGGAPRKKRKPRKTITPKGFGNKLRTKSQWPRKGSRKIPNRKFGASSKSGGTEG